MKRESSFEPLTESICLRLERYNNNPDFSEIGTLSGEGVKVRSRRRQSDVTS